MHMNVIQNDGIKDSFDYKLKVPLMDAENLFHHPATASIRINLSSSIGNTGTQLPNNRIAKPMPWSHLFNQQQSTHDYRAGEGTKKKFLLIEWIALASA